MNNKTTTKLIAMQKNNNPKNKYFISRKVDIFFTEVNNIRKFIGLFFQEVFIKPYEMKEKVLRN